MSTDLIRITDDRSLQIKEFNEQRVVTFKDIDFVHERPDGTVRKNFNNNKQHFIDGTDYFIVQPSDVNNFPIQINNAGTTLITESGYLRRFTKMTERQKTADMYTLRCADSSYKREGIALIVTEGEYVELVFEAEVMA